MNAKEEAFAIKMEEIMKEMLSTEAFEQLATTPEPEFAVDVNTITSSITEEDMIRIIKKEPNEKPLLVEDYTPLNPAKSNKVSDHPYNRRLYSQTSVGSNEHSNKQNSIEQQISTEENLTEAIPPEPITPDSILTEQISAEPIIPEHTIPGRKIRPKPTIQENNLRPEPITIPEQSSSEVIDLDFEPFQHDKSSIVDVKPIVKKPTIDYISTHCDICGISFNDNFGFRRHLNHMHKTNNLAAVSEELNSSSEPVEPEIPSSSSSSPSPPPVKRQTCNLKFKRQYRANLKVKHINSTLSIPESHSKSSIQCRFCKKEGWTESEYRQHLIQRHSTELNSLTKQITDSSIERIKDVAAAAAATTNLLNTTSAFTSRLISNSTITNADTLALPNENDSLMADPDISILDIPYDPIPDISENQRRTYNFFQAYMLDIS